MMNFYTYLYRDPSRNNEPIYVGKGRQKRAFYHLGRKDKHPFTQRLQWMKNNGIQPVVEFLCKDVDEELAHLCEMEAIDKFGRKDLGKGPLLNLTDGGEGLTGFKMPEEQKAKIRAANKGRKGRPHTLEERARISAAKKGRIPSEEEKAKMRASLTGRKLPEEVKAKMRAAALGRKHTDEAKAKMRAAKSKLKENN